MLQEDPKKQKKKKDYSNPTRAQLFWRVQKECLRRSVTPMLMYMFMSMIMLVCMLADVLWLKVVLGLVCIAAGGFFNGNLCFQYGKMHYGAYIAGELHRQNAVFGIQSGGDHRPEREYRWWKGPLIGFYVSLPVLVLGIISGSVSPSGFGGYALYAFAMFAGYGILPLTWFGTKEGVGNGMIVSPFYSLLFMLVPIIVSAVFYNLGAWKERKTRERGLDQTEEEAGKKSSRKK